MAERGEDREFVLATDNAAITTIGAHELLKNLLDEA
jgi:hypothetical protein